ncbi:hypothetical protein GGR56DRAFT_637415 [Xylariaceae sp. FL0804]|nr:hypothetical protein GGR56DRAFT_637415 [Xylariaceae sp. FL0804]
MMTQLTYAVDFLKAKRAPKTLQEVLDHLTLNQLPDMQQKVFASLMQKHSRIQHLPAPPRSNNNTSSSSSGDKAQPQPPPAWRTGRYTFKAKIAGVHDKVSLLEHLQRKTDASGLSVKDLKDGWPDCDAALAELERDRKVLVVRTRKDNHAKFVWPDDPRLLEGVSGSGPGGSGSGSGSSVIDAEFQALWHKIELPSLDDIVRKLQAVGQKPASEDPRLKRLEAPKQAAKKRRAARPPKNQSNSHMAHLLKDFSHMKR